MKILHGHCRWHDRRVRPVHVLALAAVFCVSLVITCVQIGCVKGAVQVQVGPSDWNWTDGDAESFPAWQFSPPTSQPSDVQTPKEIIDELFGNFEGYRPATGEP